MFQLNRQTEAKALALIEGGNFTDSADWSFTADDSNAMLGEANWTEYANWFLGIDTTKPPAKDRYAYPVGKKTTIYLSALRAIRQRSSQNGAQDIFAAAGRLLARAKTIMQRKTQAAGMHEFTLRAAATISAAADNGGKTRVRRFEAIAYNGGPMKLKGWTNPLVVDLTGVSGTDKARPIFLNHDENKIVGHADDITVDTAGIVASGAISGANEHARQVLEAHDAGFPWQASIGARPDKVEMLDRGQSATVNGRRVEGPMNIARKTTLGEISFVPLGADDATSVRIAATSKRIMTMTTDTTDNDVLNDDPTIKERERAAAIAKACAKYAAMPAPKLATIQAKAIDEGWDGNRCELELLRASRPDFPISGRQRGDSPDQGLVIAAAMCGTLGLPETFLAKHFDQRTMDAASCEDIRGASLHTLIRATCAAAGRPVPQRIDNDAIRAAFEADRAIRASGYSTMSLTNVLANVQNKVLLDTYNAVGTSWQLFCATSSNKDFKTGLRIRLVGSGHFQKVGETGNLKAMSLQDQGYAAQIVTEGAVITTTRQAIINDDQAALTATPKIIGRAAAVALEKAVYTLLLSNPGDFFGTDNANLASGAGSALGVEGLTAAEQLMMKQTDPNGNPCLITPAVLLVPPELSVTANALTRSVEIRDTTASTKYPTINPHAGRFTVGTSPWLSTAAITGYSAAAWYLFGAPGDIAAFEVIYLNGQSSPVIETGETNFDTLGVSTRGFFDFGVAVQDPRAGVKSVGT